jgi:hypothetical protein
VLAVEVVVAWPKELTQPHHCQGLNLLQLVAQGQHHHLEEPQQLFLQLRAVEEALLQHPHRVLQVALAVLVRAVF